MEKGGFLQQGPDCASTQGGRKAVPTFDHRAAEPVGIFLVQIKGCSEVPFKKLIYPQLYPALCTPECSSPRGLLRGMRMLRPGESSAQGKTTLERHNVPGKQGLTTAPVGTVQAAPLPCTARAAGAHGTALALPMEMPAWHHCPRGKGSALSPWCPWMLCKY